MVLSGLSPPPGCAVVRAGAWASREGAGLTPAGRGSRRRGGAHAGGKALRGGSVDGRGPVRGRNRTLEGSVLREWPARGGARSRWREGSAGRIHGWAGPVRGRGAHRRGGALPLRPSLELSAVSRKQGGCEGRSPRGRGFESQLLQLPAVGSREAVQDVPSAWAAAGSWPGPGPGCCGHWGRERAQGSPLHVTAFQINP